MFLYINFNKKTMKKVLYISILFLSGISIKVQAQGDLKTEYMTPSSFKSEDGENLGSGSLYKISGRYDLPISTKLNSLEQPTSWMVSLAGSYGILQNEEVATNFNPDKILNAGINITHIRPLSKKWLLVSTLGGGIYSSPDEIGARSILVNGGAIFMYKVRKNFDLGIGLGLTNSFGPPIVMPIAVVNWQLSGKYEVKVNISNGMEISGAMKLNDRLKIKLVAMEMDGMSAVMDIDGQSMIYSSLTIKSYFSPEYKIGKHSSLYLNAGGAWLRSTSLTKRSLKDFFNNLFDDKDRNMDFSPAGYFAVGFKYKF